MGRAGGGSVIKIYGQFFVKIILMCFVSYIMILCFLKRILRNFHATTGIHIPPLTAVHLIEGRYF